MDPTFVEAIMTFMMPIIMNVFENQTELSYKQQFKKPCEYKDMLHMFQTLPPYFNEIGRLYPNNTDLIAYYSMQLSSTFLVNKGSLTMECLYNMLDLQSKLGGFAVGILDHPENYKEIVGQFGVYMKDYAKPLRQNAMLQILEYVDKYEKNNNKNTISVFNTFNVIFIILSIIGILGNIIVILILKQTSYRYIKSKSIISSSNGRNSQNNYNDDYYSDSDVSSNSSNYSKSDLYYHYYLIAKRYKTKLCLILISLCNLFYLKINFIIMSQFKLAAVALGQLNSSKIGCKLAFFLFPPTTSYNILHQYSVWLLVYALGQHSKKIRRIKFIDDDNEDNDDNIRTINQPKNSVLSSYGKKINNNKNNNNKSSNCCFDESGKNIFNCLLIFILIIIYNSQNLLFYTLNQLIVSRSNQTIKFCAFEPFYSNYFVLITQRIIPILNLLLFVFLPMLIGILYISFDICLFIRLKREQNKLYKHLNEYHIEWLVYVYFILFLISQLPLFIHQLADLISQAIKFPFVFPLFIALIFSNKIGLVVFEMSLICLAYSSNFLWWCLFDNDFINIIKFYFNKYILCRTVKLNVMKNNNRRKHNGRNREKNGLRILEMPTTSLIYKPQKKERPPLQQLQHDVEQQQCSTSTTSTNDDKLETIEVLPPIDYNKNKIEMIDDDFISDNNLYQQPLRTRQQFTGIPIQLQQQQQKQNISCNSNDNYENTDSFLNLK